MPIKYNNIGKAKCQAPSGTVRVIGVIYDCLLPPFPGSFLETLPFSGAEPGIPSCWPTLKWSLFQTDIRYLHSTVTTYGPAGENTTVAPWSRKWFYLPSNEASFTRVRVDRQTQPVSVTFNPFNFEDRAVA